MISSLRSRSSILVNCSDGTKIQENEKSFATLNPQEVHHRPSFDKCNTKDTLGAPSEDWSDVKHDERKKRDRILPDGAVMKLMKKSDYKGFERMLSNISFMLLNAFLLKKLDIFSYPFDLSNITYQQVIAFIPLYSLYGFQMQCMAFAGGHEVSGKKNRLSPCSICHTILLRNSMLIHVMNVAHPRECIQDKIHQQLFCIFGWCRLL
jgi:hypothetical protein